MLKKIHFLIGGKLLYNVVMVSDTQEHKLAILIHVSPPHEPPVPLCMRFFANSSGHRPPGDAEYTLRNTWKIIAVESLCLSWSVCPSSQRKKQHHMLDTALSSEEELFPQSFCF